ncbi:MAG: zf-HC2 domain-containing protein [Gemmatimonadaceae bacterium]|nr:zf-HC2 domain-containing protein [Gemmatimonadaceae bacterium]
MANFPGHQRARFTMRPTAATLSCRDAVQAMWEYLDGELEGRAIVAMKTHLDACLRCRERHDTLRAFLGAVERVQCVDCASGALRERVDRLLRDRGLQS